MKTKPRGTTLRWYENKLAPFIAVLGSRLMDDIARADLVGIVDGQAGAEPTKVSHYRAVRSLWRWSRRQSPPLVAADITEGLATTENIAHDERATEILAVSDIAQILAGIGKHRSAAALLLFAGIRPQEIWGMDKPPILWRCVNCTERIIRVPAECAKTRKARIIEGLPETLWAFLKPGHADEPVSNVSSQALIRAMQIAGGFAEKRDGQHRVLRAWPYDGTRHSFATYALALLQDPGRVSLWLGHEGDPQMLYNHYRGLATKAEAERFFALTPPAAAPGT